MGARITFVRVCLASNYAVGHGVGEGEVTSAHVSMFILPGHDELDAAGCHAQ